MASNPSKAPNMPLTPAQLKFAHVPQAQFLPAPGSKFSLNKGIKDPEALWKELNAMGDLDVEVRETVNIPLQHTLDPRLMNASVKKQNAMSDTGMATCRKRSAEGVGFVAEVFGALPIANASLRAAYAEAHKVSAAIRSKVAMDGGTRNTTGRLAKHMPKVGSFVSDPPTPAEVKKGIISSGLDLSKVAADELQKLPLAAMGVDPENPQYGIYINPKADSGYPVNVKITYPGALEKIHQLAITVRKEAEMAHQLDPVNGIYNLIREWEYTRPWLVVCKGKCKADCYSQVKVEGFEMRFYNAFGRQIVLNMQVASQVLEAHAKNILGMAGGHSAQGVSLVRGGAEELVAAMDVQLLTDGLSYVHVGDDSWVAALVDGGIVLFSLDCTSFDITQHSQATAAMDMAIRKELERIDPVSAQIWYAFARERLVTTIGWATLQWKHCGPSGLPLQSKRNDVLMDIVLQRVAAICRLARDKDALDAAIQKIGEGLHLKIRLEDHVFVPGRSTIADALKDTAFLFIGYRFYNERGYVEVFCDLPRSLAQISYPALKWTADKKEFVVQEAIRLGSTVLNMGTPPAELENAFEKGKAYVKVLIQRAIAAHGDIRDEKLRWAVQASPHGTDPVPSLSGVLRAIDNSEKLWKREEPMPFTSEFIPLTKWADILDEEEREKREETGVRRLNYVVDAKLARLKALRLADRKVPTHPPTARNLGRPGPTAVWAPDKPKARRFTETRSKGFSRGLSTREEDFYDSMSDRASEISDYDIYE